MPIICGTEGGHYPTKQDQYDKNFFLGDCRAICSDHMLSDYVETLKGSGVIRMANVKLE